MILNFRLFKIASVALCICFLSCNNGETIDSNEPVKELTPIEVLNKEISKNAKEPDLFYKRAELFSKKEAPDLAIADLAKAMKIDSTKPEYYHLLADVYLDHFKSFDAMRVMNTAAEKFPNNIPTLLKLSEYQLILKQHEKSFETIDRILTKDPQNGEAYFMLGMNLRELKKDTMAINSFQSAVENNPDLIDGWIILGQMYAELGDPLAKRYFDNALLVDSSNISVLHAKAFYLNEIKELPSALAAYRKISKFDPTYEDAYFNAGLIYLEMDSLDAAHKQLDLLMEVSPIYVKGYYYRGLVKEMKGDLEAAEKDFKQAVKFAPGYGSAKEALERVERELQL